MAKKYINWKTKGMNRDMSVSAFNPEFAFENHNLRLATNEGNTMMSWVNERGTKKITLNIATGLWEENFGNTKYINYITGIPVGTAVLNHKLIIFTCSDYIYVFEKSIKDENTLEGKILYFGTLGFSPEYPIETLVSYESENIQKVYWTDNKNQPRVINIVGSIEKDNDNQFDFVPQLQLKEKVNVTKVFGTGEFPSGVIQYAFTYYNKNGQESNIFYTTALQYISYFDRGGSPEGKIANAFKIEISNIDTKFNYLRIYSILRTSINATPFVKRVQDLEITANNTSITFIDDGLKGDSIDPTELLYKGGEEIRTKTMEQKDGTLFLGNIQVKKPPILTKIGENLNNIFFPKTTDIAADTSNNSAELNSKLVEFKGNIVTRGDLAYINSINISGFKNREVYRIGISFQNKIGKWSEPVWLRDYQINSIPSINEATGILSIPQIKVVIKDADILKILSDNDYLKARLLMAQPSVSDRTIICQGIANPCLYQLARRYTLGDNDYIDTTKFGPLYGQSSWMFRPKQSDNPIINTTASDGGGYIPSANSVYDITNLGGVSAQGNIYASPQLRSTEIGAFLKYDSFQIDHTLFTIHSPELIFDESLYSKDWSDVQLSMIGEAEFKTTFGDIDIQTSTPTIGSAQGFIHKSVKTDGNAALVSGLYYEDYLVDDLDETPKYGRYSNMHVPVSFPVFLWHHNGSLNNDVARTGRSSELLKKKISNYHVSNKVTYNRNTSLKDFDIKLFSGDTLTIEKLYGHTYMANIDTMVVPNEPEFKYFVGDPWRENKDTNMLSNCYFRLGLKNPGDSNSRNGVWHLKTGEGLLDIQWVNYGGSDTHIGDYVSDLCETSEPISIKYKSTPHLVVLMNNDDSDPDRVNDIFQLTNVSALPVVEVRKSYDKETLYGGHSTDALKANTWIPISEPVSLNNSEITLISNRGDTYYQRFECLKTYAFTPEDKNQVIDIASFIIETHVNIDGRYDRNRVQVSNLNMSPQNFNLLNPVYSQMDNFFSYKIMDKDDYKDVSYPNTITWTKTKQNGADVDLWTNITLANTLELDGDKGTINKLIRLNNQLLSFQDKGIAQILYNENTQISTTEGVPIEIANSQKVQGKRYYSDTVGCSNKWSVVQTPAGIYFIDSNEKSIYLFNGQLNNISTTGGFNSWAKQNIPSSDVEWTPNAFDSFVTYYDKLNQDVLFINKETALAYSEKFNCFTSFYDYEEASYFDSLDDRGIWIKGDNLYQHQAGEYCNFFDENKPFSMTLIANQEPQMDKIFTNLEFRACVEGEGSYDETKNKFVPNLPFDSLEVWDEYQHGISTLNNRNANDRFTHGKENEILARKFRMWACDIPRDNAKVDTTTESLMGIKRFKARPLDRIRNPWAYIKLTKNVAAEKSFLNKTEIHDIMATYFG